MFMVAVLSAFSLLLSLNKISLSFLSLQSLCLALAPAVRRIHRSPKMEAQSIKLLLCGKSIVFDEVARSLKASSTFNLGDGSAFEFVLCSEMENIQSSDNDDGFQISSYMSRLSASRFGNFLIYSPKLSSTQDVVSNNFSELPTGTVCVADKQLKGRGRGGTAWESPRGCLMFSFTLQMDNGRVVPLVQYVVSLAMTDAINDLCKQKGAPPLNVQIKWPNDLYLAGLKVGGVLCTSKYRSGKFNISAGIGLNVNNEKPTTCLNAVMKRSGVSCDLRREDVMAAFFNIFERHYDVFLSEGFQALEEMYYKTWLHSGQRVIVDEEIENGGDKCSQSVVTVQGLTASGFLLAVGDDGKTRELHPNGSSLDFFKGLISRKPRPQP